MSHPEDEPTEDARREGDHFDARLARLERAVSELAARLQGVERALGTASTPRAETRPFAQGVPAPTPRSDETRPPEGVAPPPETPSAPWYESTGKAARPASSAFTESDEIAGRVEDATREDGSFDAPTPQGEGAGAKQYSGDEYTQSWMAARAEYLAGGGGESAGGGSATGGEAAAWGRGESSAAAAPAPARARRDIESLIGGNWFNWAGIIAVTFGVAFFLKYAFESEWIGPRGRVLLGGAAGAGILALAERLRLRGYRSYAYVLSGGGILILYLSAYAARGFYELVGVTTAFLLMSVVTTTAVLLSVRHDARAIAVLGLLGGFATPVLLSTGTDRQVALFTYVALLDAGVLALAYFKRWRDLNYLAYALTVVTFAGWALRFYEDSKLWRTLFFLTLFFLMFSALAVLHNVLKRRRARWFDVALVASNATLYFAASYALVSAAAPEWAGAHALLVSAFFAALAYFARTRHREDELLAFAYAGAAATFLTMAVAIQLEQHWVTIGWAAEGLLLTWLGLRTDTRAARYAALPVLAFAVLHWFAVDMPDFGFAGSFPGEGGDASFVPLLNRRAVSAAALVASFAGSAWLYRRRAERVEARERDTLAGLFVLAGNALAFTLLTLDVNDYFNRALAGAGDADAARASIESARQFALTLLWTFYAAGALAVGVARRLFPLRAAALTLLAGTVIKLLAVDALNYSDPAHTTVFNQTFAAFAVVVAALAFGARLYSRANWIEEGERAAAAPVLLAAANLLAVAGLSLEAMGHFNRAKALAWGATDTDPRAAAAGVENTKQLVLTLVWAAYAAAAFTLGVRRGRQYLRAGALALLAAAALKALAADARFYAAPWHAPLLNQTFAAFAALVLCAWYFARLYSRAEGVGAEERRLGVALLTVSGNLFAVVALSLEASGYFRKQSGVRAAAGEFTRDLRLAQQLSLSLVWAVYGGALLLFGHLRQNRLLRLVALALLAATTLKVFFFDLAGLERLYRIISFIVLGVVLLAVSFLYQQRQRRAAKSEGAQG